MRMPAKRLARAYRNLPLRHKLRLVIMLTVTLALLCACAAVFAFDGIAARGSMRNNLEVQGKPGPAAGSA